MSEVVTLGELVRRGVLDAGDGYRTKRSEHGQPGFRILRVADVMNDTVSLDGPDFVSLDFADKIGAKLSEPGDVLLTTKGTVGRVARMPEDVETAVYSPQLCYFRVRDDGILDPRFLQAWFMSDEFRRQASYRADSTDMAAYINLRDIRSLELALPPIATQRDIAEVLGALDDKIAANSKIARTADDLAQAKFMAVSRTARMSDLRFDDVATVGGGGTPSSKVESYWNGPVAWATPTDVTALQGPYIAETSRTITNAGLAACSSPLYPMGSILMTSRATIGAFALTEVPLAVNQGFIVVVPNHNDQRHWLFHEMRSRISEFTAFANGATFLELSRGSFKQFKVRLADEQTMREFEVVAAGLHERASAALQEKTTLAATRDALLPALMSGKLRVKDAERHVEAVV